MYKCFDALITPILEYGYGTTSLRELFSNSKAVIGLARETRNIAKRVLLMSER